MNIKFKIIEVHDAEGSVVVRFYTDTITEEMLAVQRGPGGVIQRARTDYNIDLPVPAPEGAALDSFILSHAPRQWLERQEAMKTQAVTPLRSLLKAQIGVEKTSTDTPPTVQPAPKLNEIQVVEL